MTKIKNDPINKNEFDAQVNDGKLYLTLESVETYKTELNNLINVERPKIIEEIKDARAQGDLSENSEYDSAREKQGQIEDRIKEIEYILENYTEIQNASKSKKVTIGSKVLLKRIDNKKQFEVKIVGTLETDPFLNKISYSSPISQGIMGSKIGDVREINAPTKYEVEILKFLDN
ncbi:transcription elongation factor GreA [[Mycoplasma] mobile]|uniref:Transcription elongation factor GreA n=1 Tax=Mycoplasma mobile (strain ATCC 43663 / 163K / NCTC 11711) TaxID=267748 RepID=Q6KHK9_MYCM1|nr:transcription elongation factor GreA [[Mycoplasma] mobile]AAT27921.1 transcription elongation factor [Mycoplasma mobile 163K]